MTSLLDVPGDNLEMVLQNLDFVSANNLCSSSREIRKVCDNHFWYRFYMKNKNRVEPYDNNVNYRRVIWNKMYIRGYARASQDETTVDLENDIPFILIMMEYAGSLDCRDYYDLVIRNDDSHGFFRRDYESHKDKSYIYSYVGVHNNINCDDFVIGIVKIKVKNTTYYCSMVYSNVDDDEYTVEYIAVGKVIDNIYDPRGSGTDYKAMKKNTDTQEFHRLIIFLSNNLHVCAPEYMAKSKIRLGDSLDLNKYATSISKFSNLKYIYDRMVRLDNDDE